MSTRKTPMQALVAMRDALKTIDGITTCKIGMEAGITPADYPLIRLVPSTLTPEKSFNRKIDLLVYFGEATDKFTQAGLDGLEEVYARLFELEDKVKNKLKTGDGYAIEYVETITDEDKLTAFKLFAARFEVTC
jgi:hypothetical protein